MLHLSLVCVTDVSVVCHCSVCHSYVCHFVMLQLQETDSDTLTMLGHAAENVMASEATLEDKVETDKMKVRCP